MKFSEREFLTGTKMSAEEPFIVIDNAFVASGGAFKVTNIIHCTQYWHKIIVTNADTESRDLVLSTLMEAVRPHDFMPYNYKVEEDGTVTFLVKNCGQAILQFCWMHLTVPHPEKNKNRPPFRIKVILREKLLGHIFFGLKSNLVKILKRRYNRSMKRLNLDQFHQDPELTQFFHLSQPKRLSFVLDMGRDLQIEHLKLSNNDIESLNPFEAMCNERCLKGLCEVDLSNNKIKSAEELRHLTVFPIQQLILDGNPICNEYTDHEYMKAVTKHLPHLSKLDDCILNKLGVLPFQKNFMCSQSGHELVDRFLAHYYNLYDSSDRNLLEGMYHRNAMFSLTQHFLADQISSKTTKIMSYKKYARNIKSLTDLSKSDRMMFVGNQMISNIFTALPLTEHDPNAFTVDLTKFEGSMLVLTVTGIYKHPGMSVMGGDDMYNFMRTFILIRVNDEEYKIINDLMDVTNATSSNQSMAFKTQREPNINYVHVPVPKNKDEVREMIETFVLLTNMKPEWAKKCLMECEFDLKRSLNLFVSLYKEDKLPQYAFNHEEAKSSFTLPPLPNIPPPPPSLKVSERSSGDDTTPRTHEDMDGVEDIISKEDDSGRSTNGSVKRYEDNKKDSSVNYDVNTMDLSKITDELVKNAVLMPLHRTSKEAKIILSKAAERVLSRHKNDVWYYCLLGSEFYKNRFLEEGRSFLARGKDVLSPENYEKLSLDFLLFEIEYGDMKYVDEVIKKKIVTESIESVLEFVLKRVPNISRGMTRTLLWRMAHYTLLIPDVKKILAANKKFEMVYGSTERLERIIKLEEELFGLRPKSKTARRSRTSTPESSSRSRSPHRSSRGSPYRRSRRTRSISPHRRRSRSPAARNSNSDYRRRSRSPPARMPTKRRSRSPSEQRSPSVIIKKTAEIIKKSTELTRAMKEVIAISPEPSWRVLTFEEFRSEILKPIGVHVYAVDDPDVKKIEEFTGSNALLIQTCEAVLKDGVNRFSVVSAVYKKYWERNMVTNIRDLLARAKVFPNSGLVNNLIVLFKIRMQLKQRNQSDTLQKIHLHVNKIPFKDVINFFESLSQEFGDHVNEIFESCLANVHIDEILKRIIILKYKAFCNNGGKFEKYRKDCQFEFYLKAYNHMLFNFDETVSAITNAEPPFVINEYTTAAKVRKPANDFMMRNEYSVEKCAQVAFFLFQKFPSESQSIVDSCKNMFENEVAHGKDDHNKALQLSLIMAVTTSAMKFPVRKLQKRWAAFDLNANLVCCIAEIFIIRLNLDRARSELMSYINNPIILDVDVQKCMFQYFESWKRKYNVDMLSVLLRKKSNSLENQTTECVEVLISSDDDEDNE